MHTDWSTIHARLAALDVGAQVRVAKAAAGAVLPVATARVPPAVRTAVSEAVVALDHWSTTGHVPVGIKDIACAAYASVGGSGLPPGEVRHAGLAAAHAAFALHFWSMQHQKKAFVSARDAVSNALAGALDPSQLDDIFGAAEKRESSS